MLIHEVVTFSCYLVSNVRYRNHILFLSDGPSGRLTALFSLKTAIVFIHFADLNV